MSNEVKYFSSVLPILVIFYNRNKKEYRRLHFRWIKNAISRSMFHAMDCSPGDVIEMSHADTGMWLSTIKVHAGANYSIKSAWDKQEQIQDLIKVEVKNENDERGHKKQSNELGRRKQPSRGTGKSARAIH